VSIHINKWFGALAVILSMTSAVGIPTLLANPAATSHTYALIVGGSGGLYSFDGKNLNRIPTPTTENLTDIKWKHDGSYALISGEDGTLLKYDGTSMKVIPTGLGSEVDLEAISWKPDDSEALIVGTDHFSNSSYGVVLRFDGNTVTQLADEKFIGFRSVAWSADGIYAILAGYSTEEFFHGHIARLDGNTLETIPAPTNDSLNAATWYPRGNYAFIGGDVHGGALNTTLFQYNGATIDPVNTFKCCFTVDAHTTRSISFDDDTGMGVINGNKGLVILFDQGNMSRIRTYTIGKGNSIDLHHIGDFYSAAWVPGAGVAYAVGTNGTIARIASNRVALMSQGTPNVTFRSIGIIEYPGSRVLAHVTPLAAFYPESNLQIVEDFWASHYQRITLDAIVAILVIVFVFELALQREASKNKRKRNEETVGRSVSQQATNRSLEQPGSRLA